MDLSALSDADLLALKAGDLTKVSDQGLMHLKGQSAPAAVDPQTAALEKYRTKQVSSVMGAVRGAGSIGATLATPYDLAVGNTQSIGNPERRTAMDAGATSAGADPNSWDFKIPKMIVEAAGTAGVGGLIAKGLGAIPYVADLAPNLLNSIRTYGMTAGEANPLLNMATRVAGGAISGAGTMGLIDPKEAATGAKIGAITPPVVAAIGTIAKPAGELAAKVFSAATRPRQVAAAEDIANALEASTPEQVQAIVNKLRSAPTLVQGSSPTAAQALQSPQASILERVIYDSPGAGPLRNQIASQGAARTAALESVAPTGATGYPEAAADFGNSVANTVIPAEKKASQQISAMYRGVDSAHNETINLPVDAMQAAVEKYAGKGTFGASNSAQTAADTARGLSNPVVDSSPQILNASGIPFNANAPATARAATWEEVSNLRSSINKAWGEAKLAGDKQSLAALSAQKAAIDQAISNDLSPAGKAAWLEANASHAAKMQQFHTGPQTGIFRAGSDGQPVKQGGEIAQAFWGNRPGLAEDVNSFKRLVDEQPGLMGQFKSLITTHGNSTSNAAGELTTKFSKWVDQTLPGLRNAFSPEEVQTLQRIAQDIDRAASARSLGTSLGGSNTYQNASNALSLGVLDSPAANALASKVPLGGMGFDFVRQKLLANKATRMAELLRSNTGTANALEQFMQANQPGAISQNDLAALLSESVHRGAARASQK